jgi:superfamily II DNA or RNA helicase
MLLRPRQKIFVDRCLDALGKHGNTLGVAPTGSGKTVMLSAAVGRLLEKGAKRALILQHRDELTAQNRRTFHAVNPDGYGQTGVIDSTRKDWHLPVAFGMVPTLARNLKYLKPVDVVVVDEAHHSTAATYRKVIAHLYELNPDTKLIGVTATSQRGDKMPLSDIYSNVCDQISVSELIHAGVLVRPRFFVIDLGVREDLANVRKTVNDFDMMEVAKIMDHKPLNNQVVEHWKEKAGDRQTVVFCSTVAHAAHVRSAFNAAGVSARVVTGETSALDRRIILADFDAAKFQVLVNVMVLTEGWDCQPVDCIVLLRPASYKSTMIQMIGRGLRRIDAERYPGRSKSDCLVLDFGTSVLTHGTIEMDAELTPEEHKGEGQTKECPECSGEIPAGCKTCPLCGYVFEETGEALGMGELTGDGEAPDFVMTEIDIFNASPFKWEEFWDGVVFIANGFDAFGMTIFYAGEWHAIAGARGVNLKHLARGDKILCLSAADDFIRQNEQEAAAHKSRRWLHLPPTDKQLYHLGLDPMHSLALNRYRASCLLTWKFQEARVQKKLAEVTMEKAA